MLTIDVLIFFKFVYCGMSWLIRNAFWVRLSWAIYINMVYNNMGNNPWSIFIYFQ